MFNPQRPVIVMPDTFCFVHEVCRYHLSADRIFPVNTDILEEKALRSPLALILVRLEVYVSSSESHFVCHIVVKTVL